MTFPDAERTVITILDGLPEPVGTSLPSDWTPDAGTFIQIEDAGTIGRRENVVEWHTIRCVAWSKSRTEAKRAAAAAVDTIAGHPPDGTITQSRRLTAPLAARDRTHQCFVATGTCRVGIRNQTT